MADENNLIDRLRRTWDAVAEGAASKTNKSLTAQDVRAFVRGYIEGEMRFTETIAAASNPLTEDEKCRLLAEAFPEGETYEKGEAPSEADA